MRNKKKEAVFWKRGATTDEAPARSSGGECENIDVMLTSQSILARQIGRPAGRLVPHENTLQLK